MSAPGEAVESATRRSSRLLAWAGPATLYRLPVYAACTGLALLSSYLLGRDLMWDTLNYHLYAGWSALHDRFGEDYFAAGSWSYLNPYAYVPFYLLAISGPSALAASSVLAVLDGAILWLTYELAVLACPSATPRVRMAVGVCAVALTFFNPVLLQQLGSSFTDVTTALPVLGGWLLLVRALQRPASSAAIICAGLLIGAGTALKLTNAVHAIAACALLGMLPRRLPLRLRACLQYGCGLGAGFAAATLPWSYQLARTFGNPLFPLLNGVFRSPEMTTAPLLLYRFIPADLPEALWRPFAMLDPVPLVHVEDCAPELRYAVLMVLLIVLAGGWLRRRLRPSAAAYGAAQAEPDLRILTALGVALALDWVLWLRSSGNSRYFLPASSVASVVLVLLIVRLFARRPRLRNYALMAIISLQAVQVYMGTGFAWQHVPWGGPWFQVTVPEPLTRQPNLYLSVGMQSDSFLAPFLASGSGFVNLSGAFPLGADGPAGERIRALLRRHAPHLRMLVRGLRLYEDGEQRLPRRSAVDEVMQRFDLRVDPRDCATIAVHDLAPALDITVRGPSVPAPQQPLDTTYWVSCQLVAAPADHSAEYARQQTVDEAFAHLEDACPELFQPRGLRTEHHHDQWLRRYVNTDLIVWISHGQVAFRDVPRGDPAISLGDEAGWEQTPPRLACGRSAGHYFARVIPANASH